MKNKIILLVMMLLPMVAGAETVEIDGIYYNLVSKSNEAEVCYGSCSYVGDAVIPPTIQYDGKEYHVTSIGDFAFCLNNYDNGWIDFQSNLKSVIIPSSVKRIGEYAFAGCTGLTTIAIPNSTTDIGKRAFIHCQNMKSISFGNSLQSIGSHAFYTCKSLTSLILPNSLKSIEYGIFENCSSLTSVVFGNNLATISLTAFKNCTKLSSVQFGKGLNSIGVRAFESCIELKSIIIPNSVTSIGGCAFSGCRSLASVTIGSGVKGIDNQAFASCKELTDVYCMAEAVPSTGTYDVFQDSYIEYATLHVPTSSIDAYKAVEPWKNFKNIVGLDGTIVETQKCSTPTISFDKSGLVFSCETPDVEYAYEIKDTDIKKGFADGNKVELTPVYTITVQAVKAGYESSDVATATIRWRNGSPVFQGFVKVDAGEGALWGDVNIDGQVDVADIANIIDIMAGKARMQVDTVE